MLCHFNLFEWYIYIYIYILKRQGFKRVLPRTRTVNIIFCLFWQHGVCYLVEILDFSTLTLLYTHCDKNYLNLCIKKKNFTAGADATVYSMAIFWPDIQMVTQKITLPLQPWQTRVFCVFRDFRLFLARVGRNDFTTQKFLFSAIPSNTNIY